MLVNPKPSQIDHFNKTLDQANPFITGLKAFLTESGKAKAETKFSEITREDFLPERINDFYEYYTNQVKTECYLSFESELLKKEGMHRISELRNTKKREVLAYIEDLAYKILDKRMIAFSNRGTTFVSVSNILTDTDQPFPLLFPYHYDHSILESEIERCDKLNAQLLSELPPPTKEEETKFKLQRKLQQRNNQYYSEEFYKGLDLLNFLRKHHIQIKWIIFVAKQESKSIGNVTNKDLDKYINVLKDWAQKELEIQKAEEAHKAEEEASSLIAEEELKKARSAKRRKRKQNSRTAKKNPQPQIKENTIAITAPSKPLPEKPKNVQINELQHLNDNSHECSIKPHFRIHRWKTNDLNKIRQFTDGQDKPYENCNEKELLYWKHCHNLPQFERLLADPVLCDRYSYTYTFIDNSGTPRIGRGFSAQLIVNGVTKQGIIKVGVGEEDNVIYHLMFHESKEDVLPQHLVGKLDGYGAAEEKWTLTTPSSFSMLPGDIIQLEVGKKPKERTIFKISPLN